MKPFTTFMLKIHFSAQFSIVIVVVSNVNNTHAAGRHSLLHIRNLLILSISLLGTYFFHFLKNITPYCNRHKCLRQNKWVRIILLVGTVWLAQSCQSCPMMQMDENSSLPCMTQMDECIQARITHAHLFYLGQITLHFYY